MIEFKRASEKDLSVNMFVDGRFIGVFPTEKRGRLFYEGVRDKNGVKTEKTIMPLETVEEPKEESITSGADQKIVEPKKKRGRRKKVGLNDGTGAL